jgi:Ca2+/H+ antiporter
VPDDLSHLAPEEQQRRIKYRAAFMLGLGTLLVVLISDPMVSVLSEVGKRSGISPFYISFIFAPLASNASEVIASYKYALKKTSQSITISMSALEGTLLYCTLLYCTLLYVTVLYVTVLYLRSVGFLTVL